MFSVGISPSDDRASSFNMCTRRNYIINLMRECLRIFWPTQKRKFQIKIPFHSKLWFSNIFSSVGAFSIALTHRHLHEKKRYRITVLFSKKNILWSLPNTVSFDCVLKSVVVVIVVVENRTLRKNSQSPLWLGTAFAQWPISLHYYIFSLHMNQGDQHSEMK